MNLKKYDRDLLAAVEATDKRLVPLLRRAIDRGTSALEALLADHAITPDDTGAGTYHCMARNQYVHGHNHHGALKVAEGKARPSDYQFFGNPLTIDEEGSGTDWTRPSSRAALGDHLIYTFEFDCDDARFLPEQFSWALPLKEWRNSRFGKLFGELKGFADFKLLNVTYSGNKSLHINIVLDTVLMHDRSEAHPSADAIRVGFRAHWMMLKELVMKHLQPSGGLQPDHSLATSTALRRMPNGIRRVGHKHPLGLQRGQKVRQVVLWEQSVQRNSATELFHQPNLFVAKSREAGKRKAAATPISRTPLTSSQVTFCEEWLRDFYEDSVVIFASLDSTANGYVARFRNSEGDRNAGSFMSEEGVVPRLQGRGVEDVGHVPPLPLPLGQLLDHLAADADRAKSFDLADLQLARSRLDAFMPFWLTCHSMLLIHAGEGVGKSTSIMRHIGLTRMTGRAEQPSMITFSTYEDADLKAREFNSSDARHRGDFIGVLWRSFSRRYQDAVLKSEHSALTVEDADEADTSLWVLIQEIQPSVAAAMRQGLEEDWTRMAGGNVVLFSVHDVAHQWAANTFTRQMLSADFFTDGFDAASARAASELNWLIHDEVSTSTFVDRFSQGEMGWLRRLGVASGKIWSSGNSKLQRQAYSRHCNSGEVVNAVERAKAQRALRMGLDTFEPITIRDAEEYGFDTHDLTFFACDGQPFFVRARDWWLEGVKPVASRIVFLTTETVPALVAQKAVGDLVYLRPRANLGDDAITVHAGRAVNADNASAIAKSYAGTSTWVIANRLGGATDTVSPFAVRGRNDLADNDIVQIVSMFHPDQYRELQALGTWLGRDDLALLAHVDQINQSAGRNRGPRNRGAEHTLYINLTLFRAIMSCPTARDQLRYALRLHMDEVQRKNARQKHRDAGCKLAKAA